MRGKEDDIYLGGDLITGLWPLGIFQALDGKVPSTDKMLEKPNLFPRIPHTTVKASSSCWITDQLQEKQLTFCRNQGAVQLIINLKLTSYYIHVHASLNLVITKIQN